MKDITKKLLFKLTVHEHTFSDDDVIMYKDYPGLEVGDILEVYHHEELFSRLLVEVKHLTHSTASPLKDSISIQSSLATAFHLRQFNDVIVNRVVKDDVTLDKLELVFKDQFVTRSDAWRLHQSLTGSCVYFSNKVLFNNMRVHVNEMWMKDDKVACGVVSDKTRVVYRSQSAKFHIFVQMSSEMWNFDFSGDLYFEKAIMGFLQDLFSKWKEKDINCNHQVVIVLFSRTYYDAKSLDELPQNVQNEVLCSPDGRYYRDFYKIIRQSEKQDNLQNVILDLKRSFNGYPLYVGCKQPLATDNNSSTVSPKGLGKNSRASQGNLLEALNLSLNVFEKNYIDCNLEETNCTTLVITPSTGVFEVDEELTSLTRKRLIENGVGVDLVCLAEQPLHVVPLFKFFSPKNDADDLSDTAQWIIPQWINLSYYSKPQSKSSVFVHRMQVPPRPLGASTTLERSASTNTDIDYDEFDAQIFNYSKPKQRIRSVRPSIHRNITFDNNSVQSSSPEVSKSLSNPIIKKLSLQDNSTQQRFLRSMSEEQERLGRHGSVDDLKFAMGSDKDDTPTLSSDLLQVQQSDGQITRHTCVINPFKPHSMALALTLFKHRWLHAFPTDLKGISVQEHHQKVATDDNEPTAKSPAPEVEEAAIATVEARKMKMGSDNDTTSETSSIESLYQENIIDSKSASSSYSNTIKAPSEKDLFENEDWTTTIMTVDWKSLCIPACLPLTISYFPDETNLKSTYLEYHYTMVIEDMLDDELSNDKSGGKEFAQFDRSSMPPEIKFMEMISQRISQGFQFVTNPDIVKILKLKNDDVQSMKFDAQRDYVLSLGFIIHHLKLFDSEIQVTRYSLQEPTVIPKPVHYRYNVWPHNCPGYTLSATEFQFESADKYNWNNLDIYICETEKENSQLNDLMKYWRTRFLLLPVRSTPLTSVTCENGDMQQIEGFLRFLEAINKIRRSTNQRQLFSTRSKTKRKVSSDLLKADRRSLTPERSKDIKNMNTPEKSSPVPIETFKDAETLSTTPRSSSLTSSSAPSDMPPEHILSIHSPLPEIVKAMLNQKYGLHFLQKQDNLRDNTFISGEAVAWMIKSVDECNTKTDAVDLGQRLLDGRFILHASESVRQSFVDGFFLYFIKEEKKEEETEKRRFWFGARKTEEELLKSYNIQWLEVAVWREKIQKDPPEFLCHELSLDILDRMKSKESVPVFKSMEYNLDAHQKSRTRRSEWCNIVYHGHYYPFQCAYMIELDWMVATGSIIADLVQKWSHKATSYGLHVVPAPMCAFPSNSIRCSRNPFRKSPFIHLNIECLLKEGQSHLFDEFDPKTWFRRMVLFQEAILHKYDFLRDIPQTSLSSNRHNQSKSFKYVHTSGSLLVQINDAVLSQFVSRSPTVNEDNIKDSPFPKHRKSRHEKFDKSAITELEIENQYKDSYGFFWVYNYALSKKYRTSFTGDVPTAKKFMTSTFSDFCSNKDDLLLNFWNESLAAMKDHSDELNR